MPTTSQGLVYPDSSGNTQIWTHIQNLATSMQTLLDTSYQNSFSTYTPSWTNIGSGTFQVNEGYWKYIAPKLVFVNIYADFSAAGSGSGIVTVTTPTNIYRGGVRQVLTCAAEDLDSAGAVMTGHAFCFAGGSANIIDRIRIQNNGATNNSPNLVGSRILIDAIINIQGIYREA